MIAKAIGFIFALAILGVLFLVHNAMNKPIYNKMSNVWEDDPQGRQYANMTLIFMMIISFIMGLMI